MSIPRTISTPIRRVALILTVLSGPVCAADPPLVANAVEQQDATQLKQLLAAKTDVNIPQVDGMSALHWSAWRDDLATCQSLLNAGANVKSANRYGVTPLALACVNGNGEMVKLFLQAGADANAALNGGETPLMTAARTGKLGAVQALLAHDAKVDATTEDKGQTALMWAAAEGHLNVVDALLEAGADPNLAVRSGFNAWFFAVRAGHAPVVRRLLADGVDLQQTLVPQRSYTRAPRRNSSALTLATANGHFDLALELIRAGADPNDVRSGFTVLHEISWVRKPNRGDGENDDPSPEVKGKIESLEFVRQVVALGGNVNARAQRGASGGMRLSYPESTPFLVAALRADLPLMKLLVELGADPNLMNNRGTTAFLACAGAASQAPQEEAGNEDEVLECLQFLLDRGADVNYVDSDGESSMHAAAYRSMPRVVQFLAVKGARVDVWNVRNRKNWTPLMIAQGYRPGNFKPDFATIAAIEDLLRQAGINPATAGGPPNAKAPPEYADDAAQN